MRANHEVSSERRTEAAAWGFFFLWVGIALLSNVGWGVGLLGVGVITLGAQAWRKHIGAPVDHFWLVAGTLFVLFGAWDLLDIQVDVVPLLFIGAGVWFLASTLRNRRGHGSDASIDAPAEHKV